MSCTNTHGATTGRSIARERMLVALLLALVAGAFFADIFLAPGRILPASLYAVPILASAYLLRPGRVILIAGSSLAMQSMAAGLEQVPAIEWDLEMVGLAFIGLLSWTVSARAH